MLNLFSVDFCDFYAKTVKFARKEQLIARTERLFFMRVRSDTWGFRFRFLRD